MDKSKKLSAKEAMEALLAGKKVTTEVSGNAGLYFQLNEYGALVDNDNKLIPIKFKIDSEFMLYEPPKRKVKKVLYQFILTNGGETWITNDLYSSEQEYLEGCYRANAIIGCVEHEVEIEADSEEV